jgi:hypothetical protein
MVKSHLFIFSKVENILILYIIQSLINFMEVQIYICFSINIIYIQRNKI